MREGGGERKVRGRGGRGERGREGEEGSDKERRRGRNERCRMRAGDSMCGVGVFLVEVVFVVAVGMSHVGKGL